jgi:hypothetical protein
VRRLTKTGNVNTVEMRAVLAARWIFAACWEVVQSVVHQTLDLIILVRVQASQPIFPCSESSRDTGLRASLAGFQCREEEIDNSGRLYYFALGFIP